MAHSGPNAGEGYVARQKGQYADGLSKRSVVVPFIVEAGFGVLLLTLSHTLPNWRRVQR